jgi:hypothetical protein
MFGVYYTVRLYVLSSIAPSTYMFCTVRPYVLPGIAPSAYMFDQHPRVEKLTESGMKRPIASSAYMVMHALPICLVWERGETGTACCTVYLYVFTFLFS